MKRFFSFFLAALFSCGLPQAQAAGARLFKSGPIQISADGRWVWTANQDNDSVSRIDTATEGVLEVPLPGEPSTRHGPRGLSLKEDGTEVWVACHDSDRVYVLNRDGAVLATIQLPWGSGPYSVAINRNQTLALVTLHRSAALAVLDVQGRSLRHMLKPVYQSPMGIAWTEDGRSAWITHLFAIGEHPQMTRVDFSASEPKVATTMTLFATDPRHSSTLPSPQNVAEGGYLTTRGHPAQIPSASGRNELWLPVQYENITEDTFTPNSTVQATIRRLNLASQVLGNTTNDKVILSALHIHNPASPNTYLGPGWNAGVAAPVDIGFSQNGAMTYLLHEMSEDLVLLPSNTPLIKPTNAPPLTEIRVGARPMGVAISPASDIAYVYNQLSRDVSVVDLVGQAELRRVPITPVTGERFTPSVLLGARLFHSSADPRISSNSKVACGSCHINAEHDGRNWGFHRLPGKSGQRETPSLLGLAQTIGPRNPATGLGQLHRSGDRDEIEDFEHTFQSLLMGGTGFLGTNAQPPLGAPNRGRNAELDAIGDYLLALSPIPRSPYRQFDGTLSEAAIRGATFFAGTNSASRAGDAGCAACHIPETGFVDFKFHDVGSVRSGSEEELNTRAPLWAVNTPSLAGVWSTPPYNGVSSFAETIIDVLKNQAARASSTTPHGKPDGLSRRQLADLAQFVLSIDGNMNAAEVRNARDTTPPRIVRVEPTALNRIEVWFSETIKRLTATNPAAYRLERIGYGTMPIAQVVWDGQNGDRISVYSSLQPGSQYRLSPVGSILDAADMATGGAANALDIADPSNTHSFAISNSITITLGASGYEHITIPVHDAAMAGPGLSTWNHDALWLFPVNGTPRMNTGFLRFDWRNLFSQVTGVQTSNEILSCSLHLHAENGQAQQVELRRVLQSWSDASSGGDYNQNALNAPTWRDHAHPNLRWNSAGAGALGSNGDQTNHYNGIYDLAARVDATVAVSAVNEPVAISGSLITDAFRFWFTHPGYDYGYALRVTNNPSAGLRFHRWEESLQEDGPTLTIRYVVSPPTLAIHEAGHQVKLRWPMDAGSYQLEATGTLGSNWFDVLLPPTNTNGESEVVAPKEVGNRFFRLRRL